MEHEIETRALLQNWSSNPIPNLSLSASGLVVLADLHTIAQRTTVAGGSSWLDALVLAPGLHYQQAADALDREGGPGLFAQLAQAAQGLADGSKEDVTKSANERFAIDNAATANYLRRLFRNNTSDEITLDIGSARNRRPDFARRLTRSLSSLVAGKQQPHSKLQQMVDEAALKNGMGGEQWDDDLPDMDWVSHVLYLSTPILTVLAIVLDVILEEWWCLGFIGALMISRLLNIWAIKQRTKPAPTNPDDNSDAEDHDAEYTVDVGSGRRVILRGMNQDLQAIMSKPWLRNKTHIEGYLEAAAKLIVYVVAALGGNLSQAGAFILVVLLFSSAGLLGLSNAHATGFQMHGRVAQRRKPELKREESFKEPKTPPLTSGFKPEPRAGVTNGYRRSSRRLSREARRERYSHPLEISDDGSD